uniref:Claudin n=1 Tax=Eutreptiella gymnastica TaxID=73025 RepID=A0A7S1IY97_9EUGL
MAYKWVDVTIVVAFITAALFAIIACSIPEWSRHETTELIDGATAVRLERIGLWRTCIEVNDTKHCHDTDAGEEFECQSLLNATRSFNVIFFTFSIAVAATLLCASAYEWRWLGVITGLFAVVTMAMGLACWACWVSYSSRADCGMSGSYVAGAFILMVVAFAICMFFTILAAFVLLTTKGFGFDKDWSGRPPMPIPRKPYDAYQVPSSPQPPTPPPRPISHQDDRYTTPDRSSIYRVQEQETEPKPPSTAIDPVQFTAAVPAGYSSGPAMSPQIQFQFQDQPLSYPQYQG